MKFFFTVISFVLFFASAYAQGTVITGKVTDAVDGTPLAGTTVKIKGTSKATVTNQNGNFTINALKNQSLVISNIGYADQEVSYWRSNKH